MTPELQAAASRTFDARDIPIVLIVDMGKVISFTFLLNGIFLALVARESLAQDIAPDALIRLPIVIRLRIRRIKAVWTA